MSTGPGAPARGMPQQASQPEERFDVQVEADVMVPMRDGVRLATDVYMPARDGAALPGPLPAVLHRTPYDKDAVESRFAYCRWFARRGYVAIIQDCRGCFASEGEVNFLFPEAEDGFDTLAWIDEQPWTNGRVGAWGTSWASWSQTAMAALRPPNLKAIIPNQSGSNAWESSVRHAGAFEPRWMGWAFWHSAANTQRALKADPSIDPVLNGGAPTLSDWLTRLPIRRGETQLKLVPRYEDWVLKILTESDFTDYWRHPSLAPALHWDAFPEDMAILWLGAWYDSYTRATFENFAGTASRSSAPVQVLMGPWVHGTTAPENPVAGGVAFGEDAAVPDLRELYLRWFDHALRERAGGVAAEAPVRIFVMGGGGGHRTVSGKMFHGGRWRDEQEWPLARARATAYYLHADGSLATTPPDDRTSSTTYRYDPGNPVPSIGGNVSSLANVRPLPPGITDTRLAGGATRFDDVHVPGGFDQVERADAVGCRPPFLPLASRADVLPFRSAPLDRDVEVTGPIQVRLWVSTSAVDTDFTAKLIDEYPPSPSYPMGYALNLTDSIVRLRYRNGAETASFVPPGEVVEATITLYPTSNLFVAGHRIRLDVSSSNFPRFDVNPNTGEPPGTERRRVVADNTVHHDAGHPSHTILPVVPAR